MSEINISIKAARVNAELSQEQLADKLNVSTATVTNWEKGLSEPSWSQLKIISQLSRIPMDNIFIPKKSQI